MIVDTVSSIVSGQGWCSSSSICPSTAVASSPLDSITQVKKEYKGFIAIGGKNRLKRVGLYVRGWEECDMKRETN